MMKLNLKQIFARAYMDELGAYRVSDIIVSAGSVKPETKTAESDPELAVFERVNRLQATPSGWLKGDHHGKKR